MAFAMTLFGRYLALFIESSTLQIIIAISLILAAVQIAFDFSPKSTNIQKSTLELIFVAGLLGLVTSFVGIGGGILMVPYFLYKGLDPHKAIGTSSLMGFALAVSGALGALLFAPIASKDIEFFVGSAFVPAVIVTGLSSIYFARLGANLSAKTDSRYLKQAFSILIIIAAIRVFYITFV